MALLLVPSKPLLFLKHIRPTPVSCAWSIFPLAVCTRNSLTPFKSLLKCHLFHKALVKIASHHHSQYSQCPSSVLLCFFRAKINFQYTTVFTVLFIVFFHLCYAQLENSAMARNFFSLSDVSQEPSTVPSTYETLNQYF